MALGAQARLQLLGPLRSGQSLLSQECSPPSGSPGHRAQVQKDRAHGVGSSYRLRSRGSPCVPQALGGTPGWGAKAEDSARQSDSPVKCPRTCSWGTTGGHSQCDRGPARSWMCTRDLVQVFQEDTRAAVEALGTCCSAELRGGRMREEAEFSPKMLLLLGSSHHTPATPRNLPEVRSSGLGHLIFTLLIFWPIFQI